LRGEDNELNRDMLARRLARHGIRPIFDSLKSQLLMVEGLTGVVFV
jgi:hypothetical protein